MGLLAAVEEEGGHKEDAGDEAPEEDALVAGDHRAAPASARWRVSAPGGEAGGDGLGDLLLVVGVGDGGGVTVVGGEGGDLDGDGGAGEVVEGADGGAGEQYGKPGVDESEAELLAKARLWGMEADWAVSQGMGWRVSGS